MAIAVGSRRQLIYVAESTWGTTPTTPVCKVLRNTGGDGIQLNRDTLQSNEMRSDRAVADVKQGNKKPSFTVPFEFSASSYDDLLESALFGTWTSNVLKQGVTLKSVSIEEGHADLSQYQVLTGAVVNDLSLSVKVNSIVTGSFGIIGKDASSYSGTSIDATPDPSPTTTPFDSYTGSLKEGGVTIAVVTGIDLNLNNNIEQLFTLFNDATYQIAPGRAQVSGNVSLYFESTALINKYISSTETSLEFALQDGKGNSYTFLIPRVKFSGYDKSISENQIVITLPFQGLYDSTEETALKITRVIV